MFGNFSFAAGDSGINLDDPQPSLNLNPLDAIKNAGLGGINAGDVLNVFKLEFPLDFIPKNVNIDTNIPISPKVNTSQDKLSNIDLKQFLTPKDISLDDLGGAVKAIAVLIIEIFLVVVSITSQMLDFMLEFLK